MDYYPTHVEQREDVRRIIILTMRTNSSTTTKEVDFGRLRQKWASFGKTNGCFVLFVSVSETLTNRTKTPLVLTMEARFCRNSPKWTLLREISVNIRKYP